MTRNPLSHKDITDLLDKKEVVNLVKDTKVKPIEEQNVANIEEKKIIKPIEPATDVKEKLELRKEITEEEKKVEDTALYAAQLESLRVKMEEIKESTEKEKEEFKLELEKKYKEAAKKAEEYDKFLKEEEEKKMTLEEKLLAREKALIEQEEEYKNKLKSLEADLRKKENTLQEKDTRLVATDAYFKKLLEKEISTIDEKFQDAVQIIIDGTRDTVTAIDKIRDFKEKGLFNKTKEVPVVHKSPGIKDGARIDSVSYQQNIQKKLTSEDKIGLGLNDWIQKEKFKGRK